MDWFLAHTSKQMRTWGLVFGAILAFSFIVGGQIYRYNSLFYGVDAGSFIVGFLLLIILATVFGIAASLLFSLVTVIDEKGCTFQCDARKVFLAVWIILFLEWCFCLHAYWPGLLTYDIPNQTNFVFSGSWTTQQPPIHTLIWAFFLQTEGLLGLHAITWYSLFQMFCFAASLAYMVQFLAQRGINKWLFAAILAFLFLNPVLALFAITPTKDVFLAACLVPSVMLLTQLLADAQSFINTKRKSLGFVALLVMACLLRSNTVAALVLFLGTVFFMCKENRKIIMFILGAALACSVLSSGVLNRVLDVQPGSGAFASVPVQQVAHVVVNHKNELSESELATIDALFPVGQIESAYNPRFADKVVHLFKGRNVGISAMVNEIIAAAHVWAAWGAQYPADYIDAFVSLNIPYWYLPASVPDSFSERAYIETSRWKDSEFYNVELPNPDAFLFSFFERAADYSLFAHTPFALIFSPAMPVFYIVLCFCALMGQAKRYAVLPVVFFLLFFWLTFLIGPVSIMRYMLPLFCLYPFLWVATFQPACFESMRIRRGAHEG